MTDKPLVLVTGSGGKIGSALVERLGDAYHVVGLERDNEGAVCETITCDLSSDASVHEALKTLAERHGRAVAAVVHLAAYYDFTGETSPLYETVNVEGTRRLVEGLKDFAVERFVYASTMLVQEPATLGQRIDEDGPLRAEWAYPQSKLRAEEAIAAYRGDMPTAILRLAGLYDDGSAVPTLSHQIARIYERDLTSRAYAGDMRAGQAMIHLDDMLDLFERVIEARDALPRHTVLLAGEPDPMSYQQLQDAIAAEVHDADHWRTFVLPPWFAKLGAFAQVQAEPVIPDAFDRSETPFIRPFMVDMASDHYALDISRAEALLGWSPRHDLRDDIAALIASLRDDPSGWYARNGITPPVWLESIAARGQNPDAVRRRHDRNRRDEHRRNRWAYWLIAALGTWLLVSPPMLGLGSQWLMWSDVVSGVLLVVLGLASASWHLPQARFGAALVGLWVLFSPLVFYEPTAAGYINDTLVGGLVVGLALAFPPYPGVSPAAAETGPLTPPGWSFNPSAWLQRVPVILLAFVGLYFSRYLAAYQLENVDGVWDPFFEGRADDPQNGTEEIITSDLSESFPIPDAGLGAVTYMLEIIVGLIGGVARWRTMPWLTLLFGLMIVPLGAVSIGFIIIQPILLGTWSTLALIGAAAMLIQIPYSLDELVASTEYLYRRWRAGDPFLRVLVFGGTDEGEDGAGDGGRRELDQGPWAQTVDMWSGGIGLPWTLVASIAIGLWLMLTRITLGTEAPMAHADHLIGALAVTFSVIALAETGRLARFVNVLLGLALLIVPFVVEAGWPQAINAWFCGVALIALAFPRGSVRNRYGKADILVR